MSKLLSILMLVLLLAGCSNQSKTEITNPDTNLSWDELRKTSESTIKSFNELNTALNSADPEMTACSGNCFVYQNEGAEDQYIAQFQAYSLYSYAYGQGGGASAVFKLNTESEPYFYEVVLAGIQDTQLCSLVEEKQIPKEIIADCVDENGQTINRK